MSYISDKESEKLSGSLKIFCDVFCVDNDERDTINECIIMAQALEEKLKRQTGIAKLNRKEKLMEMAKRQALEMKVSELKKGIINLECKSHEPDENSEIVHDSECDWNRSLWSVLQLLTNKNENNKNENIK